MSKGSVHLEPFPETDDKIKTRDFLVAFAMKELDSIKYGEWKKLYRILAYVKRFHTNCKRNSKELKEFLTADEVKDAKIAVINHVQQSIFYAEFNSIKEKKPITDSKLK